MPDLVSNLMVSSQGKEEEAPWYGIFREKKEKCEGPGKRNRTVDGPLRVILGNGIRLLAARLLRTTLWLSFPVSCLSRVGSGCCSLLLSGVISIIVIVHGLVWLTCRPTGQLESIPSTRRAPIQYVPRP